MVSKILCPTDFTDISDNAIEYAARLAQKLNAKLTLIYVEPVAMPQGVSLAEDIIAESEARDPGAMLQNICKEIVGTFGVQCSSAVLPTVSGAVAGVIADAAKDYDLVITGSDGANNLWQHITGTHSYQVASKGKIPVMVIPADYEFRELKKIVLASDCDQSDTDLLNQLKNLDPPFKAAIHVIHISDKDTMLSKEIFRSYCSLTEERLNYDPAITFERIIHGDKPEALESVMNKLEADLLLLQLKHHGFIYRLFHDNLVKRLASAAEYPMILIQS